MIDLILFPACQNPDFPGALFGLIPGGAILIVATCLLICGGDKVRLYGAAGVFLGLFVSLVPVLNILNMATFCPATETNISHFGIEIYLVNLSAAVLLCGLLCSLYLAVNHGRNTDWF